MNSKPNKTIYRAPKLTRYGSLTEMTAANSNMASADGGTGKAHKTA